MARLAHAMSLESDMIDADIIEVQEFPSLGRQFNVTSVPKTVINDTIQFGGSLTENQFLEKVLEIGSDVSKNSSGKG
mgnify:CR=1 FL=1